MKIISRRFRSRHRLDAQRKLRTGGLALSKRSKGAVFESAESNPLDPKVQYAVSCDENWLERARNQWQCGDWNGLAAINPERLPDHPDRAKLALLAAAGRLQQNDTGAARQFIELARNWGCSKKLIAQLLISGVHNTLGRARIANIEDEVALSHFENAICIVMPTADKKLIAETRAVREASQLGLLPQAAKLISTQLTAFKHETSIDQTAVKILQTEIELLHHELSLAQQRQQLFRQEGDVTVRSQTISTPDWSSRLQQRSVSQLGQDIWVLEKTDFKRRGYFVEFGATDGVLLSNTWLLEKEFGWQGICAEPNEKLHLQLRKNRQCQVSNQYIGRETGSQIQFILADVYGGSTEFADEDQHKAKRDAYAAAGQIATFTSISLDDFLSQHNAPRDIDYVSIDTEGSEYDLLSSFPFDKWNIRLLTIEHNFTSQRDKIFQLLTSHGYRRTEQQWDDWYEKITKP